MNSKSVTLPRRLSLAPDPNDSLGIGEKNDYEPEISAVMCRYVKPGMTVVDVGANIGYFTLLLSKLVGTNGTVHAIEASPHTIELLRDNVTSNGLKNVLIHYAAAGQSEGSADFHFCDDNNGTYRAYNSLFNGTDTVSVPMITLDNIAGLQQVDFLKIDIKGAVAGAFRGMRRILEESKRMALVMAFSPASIREVGDNAVEMIELLKNNGFKMMRIRGRSRWFDSLRSRLISISYDHLLNELPKLNNVTDTFFKEVRVNPDVISKTSAGAVLAERLKQSGVRLRLFQNIFCLKH